MPVVVGQDEGAHPQGRGCRRRGGQRDERRELVPERLGREVIPEQEGVVAELLGPPGRAREAGGVRGGLADDAEAELPCHP